MAVQGDFIDCRYFQDDVEQRLGAKCVAIDGREILEETVFARELDSDAGEHSRRVQFVARLTSLLGVLLFALLAVEGVTIPFTGQLLTWHVVVGVVLIPVMGAKIIVTSYRFVLYYTKRLDFKKAGPPWMPLRIIGPLVIITTFTMMLSGVALMVVGPYGATRGLWFSVHRASFIAWFVFTAIHVLAYVLRASNVSAKDLRRLASTSDLVSRDSWYRFIIVVVVLAVGIGLGSRFGPLVHPWIIAIQQRFSR